MPKHVIVLDDRELGLVLASLLYFQNELDGTRTERDSRHARGVIIHEMFDDDPPCLDSFDALCERINASDLYLGIFNDTEQSCIAAYFGHSEAECQRDILAVAADRLDESDLDKPWAKALQGTDLEAAWDAFNADFLREYDYAAYVFRLNELAVR